MFGFVIALVAGFLTPHAEAPLARPAAEALHTVIKLEEQEIRLFSFIIAMLIAGRKHRVRSVRPLPLAPKEKPRKGSFRGLVGRDLGETLQGVPVSWSRGKLETPLERNPG